MSSSSPMGVNCWMVHVGYWPRLTWWHRRMLRTWNTHEKWIPLGRNRNRAQMHKGRILGLFGQLEIVKIRNLYAKNKSGVKGKNIVHTNNAKIFCEKMERDIQYGRLQICNNDTRFIIVGTNCFWIFSFGGKTHGFKELKNKKSLKWRQVVGDNNNCCWRIIEAVLKNREKWTEENVEGVEIFFMQVCITRRPNSQYHCRKDCR